MKYFLIFILLILSNFIHAQESAFYRFSAKTIEGDEFDFSTLSGKKVLVVNTATKCALAPQFNKLQELYEEYGGDDFEIIGFPCNDFGKREPDENAVISEYCQKKYGITFQMMEKITISGEDAHPLYQWLTDSKKNGTLDAKVTWNFQKFMVDENGEVVDFVPPLGSPENKKILNWLNE
jgi:glutathione peroxidase